VLLLVGATAIADPRWPDLPDAIRRVLHSSQIDEATFPAWIARVRTTNAQRLRDGEFDHLVHYALQSTRFTPLPPIEPALSAKAFVEGQARVPSNALARVLALARALAKTGGREDVRLSYFRGLVRERDRAAVETRLLHEYERTMRFLYQKEFVAQLSEDSATEVASLYQSRGLSSDTSIEAGYGVYVALATLKQLEPARRIARALIVGPGLDLAPRTGLLEEADPQSYQPFAVADALLALGLADRMSLTIDAIDLNPHVAQTIQRAATMQKLRLYVTSEIAEDTRTHLTDDYRAYVDSLGRAITTSTPETSTLSHHSSKDATTRTHLRKTLTIAPDVQTMLHARVLDIVADRIVDSDAAPTKTTTTPTSTSTRYDLVIVTNVFPYLSDPELAVALANIFAALAPGGCLVHNERRPLLLSMAAAIGLPPIHARTVLIGTVTGGQNLYDAIWLHRRQ
jgi:hypothetical protein